MSLPYELPNLKGIAQRCASAIYRPGRKLNNTISMPKNRTKPIRKDISDKSDHFPFRVNKNSIYREFHEKHMNTVTLSNDQRLSRQKCRTPQKAAHPGEKSICNFCFLRQDRRLSKIPNDHAFPEVKISLFMTMPRFIKSSKHAGTYPVGLYSPSTRPSAPIPA